LVLPADVSDGEGAKRMLEPMHQVLTRMRKVWLDGGYQQGFVEWLAETTGWDVEVVRRGDVSSGFQVLPHRWIVERTFGWLGRYRRLSKDYEETTSSSEAWLWLAGSRLLLARLAEGAPL
jgi:putative transposase